MIGKLAVLSMRKKRNSIVHLFFFVLQLKHAWSVLFHQPNLKWQWKVFCGALVCSSALSCHSSWAHQRQTDDLSVNVLLEEMVSHLFVHTARSPPSSFMTKQQPISWAFPVVSEAASGNDSCAPWTSLKVNADKHSDKQLHKNTLWYLKNKLDKGLYSSDYARYILTFDRLSN